MTTPKVTAGGQHTTALKDDRTVWTWEMGNVGRPGRSETKTGRPTIASIDDFNLIARDSGDRYELNSGRSGFGKDMVSGLHSPGKEKKRKKMVRS
jgi:alpha-tubulin suppressor-like RCC1 family protein